MPYRAADGHPLIAREGPLRAIRQRLAEAIAGRGSLILIHGEAGIGKTSLALAGAEEARSLGATFVTGRSYESGSQPPFAPWQEVLTDLQVAAGLDLGSLPRPFGPNTQATAAWQVLHAVGAWLRQAVAVRPAVLLLDDLHWADQDSLDLLEYTTRRVAGLPLLVLATYRDDALESRGPLSRALPGLHRDRPVEIIHPRRLDTDAVCALVESRQGSCSRAFAAYLRSRSDGNPFFLVELLRDRDGSLPTLTDDASLANASEEVPSILRQIIRQRLIGLSEASRELLEVAAVIGDEWELSVVENVLDWPEEELLQALETALGSAIIGTARNADEHYQFAHSLYREFLYGEQVTRRRQSLHLRVAEALEKLSATRGSAAASPARLAFHFAGAGQWEKAVDYAVSAGDAARAAYASHGALRFYLQALDAQSRRPGPPQHRALLSLFDRIGQARVILNRLEQAEGDFQRMREAADALSDQSAAGRAQMWLSFVQCRLARLTQAQTNGERALAIAEDVGDRRLLARALWNLGHIGKITGEVDRCVTLLPRAEREARIAADPETLSLILSDLASVVCWQGDYARAEPLAAEALDLARTGRNLFGLGSAYCVLGLTQGERGYYARARETFQAGLEYAEESADHHYLPRLMNSLGWLHLEIGDAATARDWDSRALAEVRSGQADGVGEAERYSLLNLATDELAVGRLVEAEAHLREFESLVADYPYAHFRFHNRYQITRAELALLSGDFASAQRWIQQARTLASAKGVQKNLIKALLLAGRASLAIRRFPEASQDLAGAVRLADAIQHAALSWQCRYWSARAALAQRQVAMASRQIREARERIQTIAEQLPGRGLRERFLASPLAQAVQDLSIELARPSDDHEEAFPAGLTAREVDVLRLVARGATNQAIADQLSISVKTVNAHLNSIFGKIGCANRAGAAAFAIQQGLG